MAKASAVRPYLLDLHFINKNLRFVKISFKKEVLNIFYAVVKVRLKGDNLSKLNNE